MAGRPGFFAGMRLICCLAVAAVTASVGLAEAKTTPRKFVISGGQTIEHPMAADGPTSTENADIKIEVTGLNTSLVDGADSTIGRTFGFTLKSPLTLTHVTVEDVTGAMPHVLVDDPEPKLKKKNYWVGNAPAAPITPAALPWLFAPGDDWRVFRFTITTAEKGQQVLLQPSRIPEKSKQFYVVQAAFARLQPTTQRREEYVKAAAGSSNKKLRFAVVPLVRHTMGEPFPELLQFLARAKQNSGATLMLTCENSAWVFDAVKSGLAVAKPGSLKDQQMYVVTPTPDVAAYTELGKASGLTITAVAIDPLPAAK